jgi:tetratricopeptide (TPR) repeat protein
MRNAWRTVLAAAMILAGGCHSNVEKAQDHVESGEVALGGNRYDAAVADADAAIHESATADAYYLRARAEEDRPKPDSIITATDLAKARADYQAALDMSPSPVLQGRCHAGLANVAFSVEDYPTAITQWQSSLETLLEPQWRAFAQFRIGMCQQRLSKFDDADKTFQSVSEQFPDLDVSVMAKARQGIRGFYLQLATYSTIPDAEAAIQTAKTAGVTCREAGDQGLYAVRAGPFATYALARQAQAMVIGQFPGASIGP